ncbi:Chondroitinase-B [Pedobacter sp. Bi27]|uniref:polysaccharide lyase 6 family protein n=1 Tax=Pedobacter sp. Bi27 TaxID=2822351 RepID=UPI001E12432C|nr:polysaccharide lyase 6 family protein [Pedobacter sp. Bi27]CAH0133771.1 Chondroitinase-B [Pedobacter sp. Bi27]
MKLNFCLTAILIGCSIYGSAKDYKISTAAELAALKLLPGDKVIVKNGEWTNQQMVFRGNGTQQNPIKLIAEQGGQVFFTGASSLKIDGTWLITDGLSFKNGFTKGEDVIVFSEKSANCRLTNSSIIGYNPPDKATEYTFASLYGEHNRVDHCFFEGKTNQGPTLVVWLSDKPNYHQIDHNYFGPRPDIGGNGGETIRIGTSTWSFHDSFTKVDANIFAHCNGETEIVSVKSCRNTISNNLFFESVGTLTLRHGNYNEVFGNIFIGNKIANTGGIRVIGENHKVHHNYLQGLTGTGLRAAISVMDGLPNPILVSHWQVKNAEITANTIVDCKEAFSIGAGKNADRILAPQKVVITDNLVKADIKPVSWVDKAADVTFSGNMLDAKSAPQDLEKGFNVVDAEFEKQGGIWSVKSKKAGANLNSSQLSILKTKNIGPNWFKPVQAMVVK